MDLFILGLFSKINQLITNLQNPELDKQNDGVIKNEIKSFLDLLEPVEILFLAIQLNDNEEKDNVFAQWFKDILVLALLKKKNLINDFDFGSYEENGKVVYYASPLKQTV